MRKKMCRGLKKRQQSTQRFIYLQFVFASTAMNLVMLHEFQTEHQVRKF